MAHKISWTDATWNPVRGCSMAKGSELGGCLNCYAARQAARNLPGMRSPSTGNAFAIQTDNGPRWTGKVELIESKLTEPLHWRKPRRVFVNSMSDLFHENLPDESIDKIFAVMEMTPHITYQILTKRAKRQREYVSNRWRRVGSLLKEQGRRPLDNVWLGVSVENQPTADERIPELLGTPAAVRFVSYEPALAEVDCERWMPKRCHGCQSCAFRRDHLIAPGLDWIIAGGESGPGARPSNPDWFRTVRDQCQAASVPFFFKQWGEYHPLTSTDGIHGSPFGGHHMMRVGKKAAGAILDGREWRQMPQIQPQRTSVHESVATGKPNVKEVRSRC